MTQEPQLPAVLRAYIQRGGTTYRGDDGDWEIKVEWAPPPYLTKALPTRSLVIANNGCGDHLFLKPDEPRVFVFWHDGQEIEKYLDDITLLTDPPGPAPSQHKPVFYFGTRQPVQPGDRVTVRGFLQFWRHFPGRVSYVPGISNKDRDMEHDGLAWIGIKLDSGPQIGIYVEPQTSSVKKAVRFLNRGT